MLGSRILRHANEIVGSRQEARERRRVGNLAGYCEAKRYANHVLFSNETLEEALRVCCRERIKPGRVLDVAVERHHGGILPAEPFQGSPERLTRRDLLAEPILWYGPRGRGGLRPCQLPDPPGLDSRWRRCV